MVGIPTVWRDGCNQAGFFFLSRKQDQSERRFIFGVSLDGDLQNMPGIFEVGNAQKMRIMSKLTHSKRKGVYDEE
jgi:hypothetical protein